MKDDEFFELKSNDARVNIFPKPTDGQEGLDILIKHFLGEDWYVVDPLSTDQVNTIAIYEILRKYEKESRLGKLLEFLRS